MSLRKSCSVIRVLLSPATLTTARRLMKILLPLIGCAVALAQVDVAPLDLFEANRQLLDTLRTLRKTSFQPDSGAWGDSLDLSGQFEGYALNLATDSSNVQHVLAQLPLYMDVFTTRLDYRIHEDSTGPSLEFVPPLTVTPEGIAFDDSTLIRARTKDAPPACVLELLIQRFQLYRSLGLPPQLMPADDQHSIPAVLYLHGRDLDSVSYDSTAQLWFTLRALAHGLMVYAGPTFLDNDDQKLTLRFYIAMKSPFAERHHFLTIEETYRFHGESLEPESCVAQLYPFVRADNLRTLYSTQIERN
jgi:hypothetical protein